MIREKDIDHEITFLEKNLSSVSSELKELRRLISKENRLRAVKHGKGYQYFIRKRGTTGNGEYIKQENIKSAELLAQIEYDEKIIKNLKEALEELMEFKSAGVGNIFESALNCMAPGKQMLVKERYVSDQCYIQIWKNREYKGLDFSEGFPEFYTRGGLRVRSKSEVIIADILEENAIPFLYEKPLILDAGIFHPDFTLLNIKERKEIYWEHFGMMDDMDYRNNAFSKIRKYESNGLYQHDSLIWTFETGKYPLNIKDIRKMVKRIKTDIGYN